MNASLVWKIGLFEKTENGKKAICCECRDNKKPKSEFLLCNGSTKALKVHLFSSLHAKSEFATLFTDLEDKLRKSASKQQTIEAATGGHMINCGDLSIADKRIMNLIACNNLSFGLVQDEAFKAQCKFDLKSESHYRKTVLPKVYALVRKKISSELDECSSLSFTTDCWSGPSDNFISLTAHGITKNWTRKNLVLAVQHFPGEHSGKAIAIQLRKLLDNWKIKNDVVFSFVSDSASNMIKAFTETGEDLCRILPFDHVRCASHLLNLVVKAGLKADASIVLLLEKCRRIVGHFKKSNKALSSLREIQQILEIPEHSLLQATHSQPFLATKNNILSCHLTTFSTQTTFFTQTTKPIKLKEIPVCLKMVQRLLEQKLAINQYAIESGDIHLSLSTREWNVLDDLANVLAPAEEASNGFAKSPISVQIPFGRCMHDQLFDMKIAFKEVDAVRSAMVSNVEERFFELRFKRANAISTMLDPRFKDKMAMEKPEHFRDRVRTYLIEESELNIECDMDLELETIEESPYSSNSAPSAKRSKESFFDRLEKIAATVPQEKSVSSQSNVTQEFNEFLAGERAAINSDPLDWWKKHQANFPKLAKISMKYLSGPASSVPSRDGRNSDFRNSDFRVPTFLGSEFRLPTSEIF